jgi:hypothetical protein
MLQASGGLDFPVEAIHAHCETELGVEHLERHRPLVPQIRCEEHAVAMPPRPSSRSSR